jgi:hypothetical protein
MNVIEIPVIGSWKSEKESIFTLLSDRPLRKFEGLDVGYLPLGSDLAVYFYFINQESEDYKYLWDLIIPRAIGCVVICDLENAEIFEKNVEVIEFLKDRYSSTLYICSLPVQGEEPAVLKSKGVLPDDIAEFMFFDPKDKSTAKNILQNIVNFD